MRILEKGRVKFFNNQDNKLFGFLRLESGEEIFFHLNDFQLLYFGDGNDFNFHGGAFDRVSRNPIKGEMIYFERSEGSNGRDKAAPWCDEITYRKAILEKSERRKYRVLKIVTVYGCPPDEPVVLWEGTNLDALMLKYRRTGDRTDDLFSTFSCGDFEHSIWFESQAPGKEWERCDDPRRVEGRRSPTHLYRAVSRI